jgi:hypothetical protein
MAEPIKIEVNKSFEYDRIRYRTKMSYEQSYDVSTRFPIRDSERMVLEQMRYRYIEYLFGDLKDALYQIQRDAFTQSPETYMFVYKTVNTLLQLMEKRIGFPILDRNSR